MARASMICPECKPPRPYGLDPLEGDFQASLEQFNAAQEVITQWSEAMWTEIEDITRAAEREPPLPRKAPRVCVLLAPRWRQC